MNDTDLISRLASASTSMYEGQFAPPVAIQSKMSAMADLAASNCASLSLT